LLYFYQFINCGEPSQPKLETDLYLFIYFEADEATGIPIFDPTGLRHELEMWRLEVESLRRKNYELKMKLIEGRYSRKHNGLKMG
jgi:hypothetical protein